MTDSTHVARFRVNLDAFSAGQLKGFSDWESANYYPDTSVFFPPDQCIGVKGFDADLITPDQPFSPQEWHKERIFRRGMLCDLIYTKPLIGMSRTAIQELLGAPDFVMKNSRTSRKPEVFDPFTKDCDCYYLDVKRNSDDPEYFQVAYERETAISFRLSGERTHRDQFLKTFAIGQHMFYNGHQ
jgi:hypothetical protein